MINEVVVKIPRELLELAGWTEKDLQNTNQLLLIFELYQQGKISLSKAAELAELKVEEFLYEFRKRRVIRKGGPETVEEVEAEFQGLVNLMK